MNISSESFTVRRQTLLGDENTEGGTQLVTVSIPLITPLRYSDLSAILQCLEYLEQWEIRYQRPNSPYDCTGQSFTVSLEQIKRFVSDGYFHAVYIHTIGIDC